LIVEGVVKLMEIGHLPYKKGTYDDYVGREGLERHGHKKWRRHVADVVERLRAALQPDDTVIGAATSGSFARCLRDAARAKMLTLFSVAFACGQMVTRHARARLKRRR
jgi:hypothetical protein